MALLSRYLGGLAVLTPCSSELAALGAASIIAALVSQDGESNWMEGVQLLVVYLILALGFFFLPMGG